jgi:hypothetical protein
VEHCITNILFAAGRSQDIVIQLEKDIINALNKLNYSDGLHPSLERLRPFGALLYRIMI